jgi:hypothetical protein
MKITFLLENRFILQNDEFLNDVLKPLTSVQVGDTVTNPLCEAF